VSVPPDRIRSSAFEVAPGTSDVATGHGPPAWVVGIVGFAIGASLVLRLLVLEGMDSTIFLAFGEEKPVQTAYGRSLLGEVAVRAGAGHDGKYFFIQANDPWFLDPEGNAAFLDLPFYRGQRMLYPAIASGFGTLSPAAIPWSFLVVNLIALAVGTAIAARLAWTSSSTTWLGLSVALNIGLIYELLIDGSGVLAYACCLGGVYALTRDRVWLAAALFAGAALSREVMFVFALGIFALAWSDRRRLPWPIVFVPLSAIAIWAAYLAWRLSGVAGTGTELTFLSPPFVGFVRAFGPWLRSPDQFLINGLIIVVVVAFVPLAFRSRLPLAWGALPFVALMPFLSIDVFLETPDISRAIAPIFTACAFLVLAPEGARPTRPRP
jgi:hypothetical protein